jgi:hypothetical protein
MDIASTSWHNDSGNHTSLQTEYLLSKGKHLQRKEYLSGKEKRLQVTKIFAEMTWKHKKTNI